MFRFPTLSCTVSEHAIQYKLSGGRLAVTADENLKSYPAMSLS